MKLTITVTAGTDKTQTFSISPLSLDAFLAGMQEICNATQVAVAYECSSERRGAFKAGLLLPW